MYITKNLNNHLEDRKVSVPFTKPYANKIRIRREIYFVNLISLLSGIIHMYTSGSRDLVAIYNYYNNNNNNITISRYS